MRVFPAIDLIEGQCVRLLQGDFERRIGYSKDPVGQANRFRKAGFERLHVIDLDGARTGRGRNRFTIIRMATRCRLRLQVGGGIRSSADVGQLLDAGVERVILGTAALRTPERVGRWVSGWGPQHFAIALDLKKGQLQADGWLTAQAMDVGAFIEQIAGWGVSNVICTVVERDGSMLEPDFKTYRDLLQKLPDGMRLQAAGGISSPDHVRQLADIGVSGAIVGRALYESKIPLNKWLEAEPSDAG